MIYGDTAIWAGEAPQLGNSSRLYAVGGGALLTLVKSDSPLILTTRLTPVYPETGEAVEIRSTLRIMGNTNVIMADLKRYIDHFRIVNQDINLELVESPPNDLGNETINLNILSGLIEADILLNVEKYLYKSGVFKDLRNYPGIKQALANENLLEGVVANCVVPDGSIYFIPYDANYRCYYLNLSLFEELRIEPPKHDWTTFDFYDIAMLINEIRSDVNQNVYVREGLKLDKYKQFNGFGNTAGELISMSVNSKNDFIVRINTLDMIDLMVKGKTLYELYPYYTNKKDTNFFVENVLMWELSILKDSGKISGYYFNNQKRKLVPEPENPGGNITSLYPYLSIYSLAKNPEDAALFINGFLDEDYQRQNARYLQLYKDYGRYVKMPLIPPECEEMIERLTKNTSYPIFSKHIIEFYWDMEKKFYNDELTVEEYAEQLQKGFEQRLIG